MEFLCPLILSMAIGLQVGLEELHVEGVDVFSRGDLEKLLSFSVGDTLDHEEIEASIKQLLDAYRDLGYLKAGASWSTEGGKLILQVEEEERFTIGEIKTEGNRFFSDSYILSDFDMKEGQVFSQKVLERDLDELLVKYADNGFPFCAVSPSDFKLDENLNHIDFVLRVDEGSLTKIGDVEIAGNDRTKDWVIIRELGVAKEDIYSQAEIEEGLRRLGRLEVLEVVDYELRVIREGWVRLVFNVAEKRSNSIEGIVGWAAEERELTGLVNLRANNLFGTLRSFHLRWMRTKPSSFYLRLGYREPRLFGGPLTGEVDVEALVEDTSYTVHSGSIDLSFDFLRWFTVGGGVEAERVTALKALLPNSDQVSFALHTGVDTRDSRSTPRSGLLYSLSAKYGLKSESSSAQHEEISEGTSDVSEVQCRLQNFIPVTGGTVYMAVGAGRVLTEETPPQWAQFKLGGVSTVRGYREEQFVAPQVGWLNLEYRYLLGPSGWLSPFFDVGHYRNGTSQWIYGWGLGVGLTSRLGLIRIYYGLGRDDSFGSGKIHIGMSTAF
jgi:outer membrane protein assembly factor BamA